MSELPSIKPRIAQNPELFKPYRRDPETLAREWAVPGMEGFQHRIGGLEKNIAGGVSHDPENHHINTELREQKVARVVEMIPELKIDGEPEGDLLVVGWGGTYGHMISSVREMQEKGKKVSLAHFNYIKPLPKNTAEVFSKFKKIVVCELNLGQFASYLRDKEPGFQYYQVNKVKGLPFSVHELVENFEKILEA
jgi:2-oxoglutarate ferredoxin oxidoreductase subunit alpha